MYNSYLVYYRNFGTMRVRTGRKIKMFKKILQRRIL